MFFYSNKKIVDKNKDENTGNNLLNVFIICITELSIMNIQILKDNIKRINNICDGDEISVGYDISLYVDTENFKDFFSKVKIIKDESLMEYFNKLKKWFLEEQKIDFDFDLYSDMYAFNYVLERMKVVINDDNKKIERNQMYNKTPKLSEMFDKKLCACAEISVLAQLFFQQTGEKTFCIMNGVLEKHGGSELHSFIILGYNGRNFIYDPVNPVKISGITYPRIQKVISVSPINLAMTENILTHEKWLYDIGGSEQEVFKDFSNMKSIGYDR